jgi:hypothetical protein
VTLHTLPGLGWTVPALSVPSYHGGSMTAAGHNVAQDVRLHHASGGVVDPFTRHRHGTPAPRGHVGTPARQPDRFDAARPGATE